MDIMLSAEQSLALDAIGEWLQNRSKPFFILHGPAGTGKTTVGKYIAALHNGPTYHMAFTGKAVQVMCSKGMNAKTIHGSIYLPTAERQEEAQGLETELAQLAAKESRTQADEKREHKIRKRLEELYQPDFVLRPVSPFERNGLIICDEVSMVSAREANDLLSFGLPVLVLGDPGQLPPIEGQGFFNRNPDFFLREIHRQALESPIIRLAMLAREGKPLPFGKYGESSVIHARDITKEVALRATQIITGSNKARINFNNEIRQLRGFSSRYPLEGEQVMCLRNNKAIGIFNGQTFDVKADTVDDDSNPDLYIRLSLESEGFLDPSVKVHRECFHDIDKLKSWPYKRRSYANEFTFSYACTVHKFQGSQTPRVLLYPDLFKWDREKYAQLTYTGITRAVDSVDIAL